MDEGRILVGSRLTRAEYLTQEERDNDGIKEKTGLVIVECTLDKKEAEAELHEVLSAFKDGGFDKAFSRYRRALEETLRNPLKRIDELEKRRNILVGGQ